MSAIRLPTIEECHAFMAKINQVRVAFGALPLTKLNYDGAFPGKGNSCLSATNLIKPILPEASVGTEAFHVEPPLRSTTEKLAGALGTSIIPSHSVLIPEKIRRVTDPFDQKVPGLRERLVEAGLVDPKPPSADVTFAV